MDTPSNATAPVTNAPDERVAQHLRRLTDEAEALLKATARAGDEKFDATRERLRDEVQHLRARLGEMEAAAAARVRDAARQTDAAVHAHPYSAMGVAAAAGLLLGFLMARR
jgi:ElaB/YqjD/DUF883 family membrane-anchored ribosome-binding protein